MALGWLHSTDHGLSRGSRRCLETPYWGWSWYRSSNQSEEDPTIHSSLVAITSPSLFYLSWNIPTCVTCYYLLECLFFCVLFIFGYRLRYRMDLLHSLRPQKVASWSSFLRRVPTRRPGIGWFFRRDRLGFISFFCTQRSYFTVA
jgi:hypothetical protein